MKKNSCYILLDRSGSMEHHWQETIGSVNGFVAGLNDETEVTLATFDSISYDVIRKINAKDWRKVSGEEVLPRAGTPLLDASVRFFWNVLDSKPDKAVIVIITDGHENESKKFNKNEVSSLTKQLEEKGYELIFLGANFDKINENVSYYRDSNTAYSSARSLSMTSANFTGTMGLLSEKAVNYFNSGKPVEFTEEEKKDAVK
jgi:hypothetical protein